MVIKHAMCRLSRVFSCDSTVDIASPSTAEPGNLRGKDSEAQNTVNSLQLFEILVPVVHCSLLSKVSVSLIPEA